MATNPFPDKPPRFIRAELYEYRFAKLRGAAGDWWVRERRGVYLAPLSQDDPYLAAHVRGMTVSP